MTHPPTFIRARVFLAALIVVFTALLQPAAPAAVSSANALEFAYLPLVFGPANPVPLVEVDFVDVGQGDAILILSSEGEVALIDGGETNSGIVPYLTQRGIPQIDLIIATHPHADHIGGLVQVLAAFPVDKVVTNGDAHTTVTYENFLDGIAASGAEYVEAARGDTLAFGSLTFEVLSPAGLMADDFNNNSLVTRLDVGEVSFLFTGDAESEAEALMVSAGVPLRADILKVGHHGSSTSTSQPFLDRVQPSVAVYMAGTGNSYGHPSPTTLARLANAGAEVYGTDQNGTVSVLTDGATFQVLTERGGQ